LISRLLLQDEPAHSGNRVGLGDADDERHLIEIPG
jgi:hypothetical protein